MPRACLVLLGVWLGLVVASWAMASASFRTAERVLGPDANPEQARRLLPLAPEDRRMVMRHFASELNRWMFGAGGMAQAALALAVLALAWPAGGTPRMLMLLAAGLVLAQLVGARSIVDLGRSIDFVPRPLPAELARRFGMLHAAYVVADLVKAGLLATAAWLGARG